MSLEQGVLSALLAAGLGVPAGPAPPAPAAKPVTAAQRSTGFPDAFVLEHRLVVPPPRSDRDRDGLVDEGEARLAQAFRPYLVFDRSENALRPGEPVTLFQVRPLGCAGPPARCGGEPLRLRIAYVFLWRDDGGYPHILGLGAHRGDNQSLKLEVVSEDAGRTFRIVSIANQAFDWPKHGARFLDGTHPWVVFSAGKHHQFFDTRHDGRASPLSVVFPEAVDGRGPAFLADLRGPGGRWNNAGEPDDAPNRWLIGSLGPFGFGREHAFGELCFCGGQACDKRGNPTATMRSRWSREPFFVP